MALGVVLLDMPRVSDFLHTFEVSVQVLQISVDTGVVVLNGTHVKFEILVGRVCQTESTVYKLWYQSRWFNI